MFSSELSEQGGPGFCLLQNTTLMFLKQFSREITKDFYDTPSRVWVYVDNWNTFVKHSTRASNQRTGILKGLIHYPYLSDIEDNSRGLDLFISHFSIQSLLTGKLFF